MIEGHFYIIPGRVIPGTGSDPSRQDHARDKNVSTDPDITINVTYHIAQRIIYI